MTIVVVIEAEIVITIEIIITTVIATWIPISPAIVIVIRIPPKSYFIYKRLDYYS